MQTTEAPTSSRDPLSLPPVPPMARDAHRARDFLVSALFALALGVPGLALYDTAARTVTEFENRPAAPWPRWQELDAGSEFTTAFERAFADRFGTRNTLIRLHHAALAGVLQTSPASNVLLGRDGWLYFKGEDGKAVDRVFRRSPAPSAPEIAAIAGGITRRVNVLAGMDIDYLLVVVPDKYTIYPEFLPSWVRPLSDQSPLDATLAMLPAEVRAHVLDLRPALLAAKKQRQIHFRTDSHWNASGAWAGYQEILAAMR
jgi:alginate O-acetyltransferase complex protein AlgJ